MLNFSSKSSVYIDKAAGPGVTIKDCDTVTFKAGDYKLRALMTDTTTINGLSFKDINGPCVNDFVLAIEKPGHFVVDYNVPKNDLRLQTMHNIKVGKQRLNLTAVNNKDGGWRSLSGSLEINPSTKVFVSHVVGGNTKFGCHYLHNGWVRFEPSYNLQKNALKIGFSYMQPTENGDIVVRYTYKTATNKLGLELTHSSETDKPIKFSASVDLEDVWKMPKLCFESMIWDFDI